MKTQCQTNNHFAELLISNLTHLGVHTFCIGSGSRSAPLARALKNNALAHTVLHYDERSLGFFALGAAKASLSPVCVITTSGSAIANLFPAIMEAYMDNVPLIIITCDRTFEDLDRGENQTCAQENIFGRYITYSKTLPAPPHPFNSAAISSSISYLFAKAKSSNLPVHLNIPFREPLIENSPAVNLPMKMTTTYLPINKIPNDDSINYIVDILSSCEKGIIVAGGGEDSDGAEAIIALAEKISYPILADPLSGIREKGTSSVVASHYNQIIHHTNKLETLKPDVILFIGGHIISKNILVWAKGLKDTKQIVITEKERHIDPTLQIETCITCSAHHFCALLNTKIKRKPPSLYLSLWKGFSLTIEKSIATFFEEEEKMHEPMAITNLLQILDHTPFSLFIGNSLPIRYADNFLFPKKITKKIYGNRGVSGIDGNISTALGICQMIKTSLVTVIGDCTFLYDVGALHLMSTLKIPLIIIVINNNGGGIFNFLPYSKDKNFIESHISPPTNLHIGNIAASFNIPFWRAEASSDYTKMVEHLLTEKTGGIIEIPSCKEKNVTMHQRLEDTIEKHIAKSIKKERTSYFFFPKRKSATHTSYVSMDS